MVYWVLQESSWREVESISAGGLSRGGLGFFPSRRPLDARRSSEAAVWQPATAAVVEVYTQSDSRRSDLEWFAQCDDARQAMCLEESKHSRGFNRCTKKVGGVRTGADRPPDCSRVYRSAPMKLYDCKAGFVRIEGEGRVGAATWPVVDHATVVCFDRFMPSRYLTLKGPYLAAIVGLVRRLRCCGWRDRRDAAHNFQPVCGAPG